LGGELELQLVAPREVGRPVQGVGVGQVRTVVVGTGGVGNIPFHAASRKYDIQLYN